ncbi:MAG: CoA-binding protein [Betaproteobacteria bacterium]|nr:CoA-binding protein [Betaproteobacteria bacterium]
MSSIDALLNPRAIAVVGASQKGGRGALVIANLRKAGYKGGVYAIHPRYTEVEGVSCHASVAGVPARLDCVVIAIGADAACEVLEEAYSHGVRGAVVLSAGFGEGGHGNDRVARLLSLAGKGMAFCGPNSFGAINTRSGAAMFSGPIPLPLKAGPVALISQSGGLGMNAFAPLMRERGLGFSHIVTCGNQVGTTIEDFIEYFLADPEIGVIAVIVESLKNPAKLRFVADAALRQGKTILFYRVGRSAAGQVMAASHTGALTTDATLFSAYLRRCGILQIDSYDQFVEAIELFGVLPDRRGASDVIVLSGSGGGAAAAADALEEFGVQLAPLEQVTKHLIQALLPDFGSVGNPIDGTGALHDDPALAPQLFDAITRQSAVSVLAASVNAPPEGVPVFRRVANDVANAARSSGWPVVAYQSSPLGAVDGEIVKALNAARVPLLLGVANAMGAIRYIAVRDRYRDRAERSAPAMPMLADTAAPGQESLLMASDFMSVRRALMQAGVNVVDAGLAASADASVAEFKRLGTAVVLKAEIQGLLHKSDIGCVRLNCSNEDEVRQGYLDVISNARKAGFASAASVLVQPMIRDGVEVFAGAITDPLFGTAITFGLGGIFIQIMRDTATEMAPLALSDAQAMMERLQGRAILQGARGRPRGDIDALAELLVRFGRFAALHGKQFRSLDLNPIIVRPEGQGVLAVDIALER